MACLAAECVGFRCGIHQLSAFWFADKEAAKAIGSDRAANALLAGFMAAFDYKRFVTFMIARAQLLSGNAGETKGEAKDEGKEDNDVK